MRRLRTALVATALLLMAACSGDKVTAPAPISAEGAWSGTTAGGTVIALTLAETTGSVTGTGTFTTSTASFPLQATGTYVEPQLSLTISAQGFNNVNLTTTVGKTSMSGTLNGSGFLNEAITFQRQ